MSWAVKINLSGWRSVDGPFADPEDPTKIYPDYDTEYYLATEDGPPPEIVPLPASVEAAANGLLDAKLRQANAQVTALQGRIDAINDGIEFEEALPEEIAELPVRKSQLTLWKKYRIELGRVKATPGWYQTPAWPVVPEPYTSETSANMPTPAV